MKRTSPLYLFITALLLTGYYGVSAQCTSITLQKGATKAISGWVSTTANGNGNYNGYPAIATGQWTANGNPIQDATFFKYDLSQIPAGSVVTSARLSLYADSIYTGGYTGQPTYGNNNASYIRKATGAWNPATITWNNQPGVSDTNRVLLAQSTNTDQDYLNIDVKAFVQGWVNSPSTNYGMQLRIITQSYYNSMIFCSANFPDSTKWPKLEICFTPPASNTPCVTFQRGSTRATGALIGSILPNNNYEYNSSNVDVLASQWTYNSTPGESRGLFRYDISSIPVGTTIVSARLSLYADTACPNNGYRGTPTWGSNNACYLKRVTTPWSPSTVAWNSQPTATTANQVLLPQSTSTRQDYLDMDISKFVQSWVDDPSTNYGMMLDMIGTNYYNSLIFVGPTNVDTAHWPKLEICYSLPCTITGGFAQKNLGGGVVKFTDTSSIEHSSTWAFYNANGQFITSSDTNPQIKFTGLPPYSAKMIINDGSCSDTITEPVQITTCVTYQQGNTKGVNGYASSALPNNNYNYPALDIIGSQWTFNGVPGEIRGMLKYDLAGIPAGVTIAGAKLSLYADTASPDGYRGSPTYGSANASFLQQITSEWNPATLTWNTMPSSTSANQVLLPQSGSPAQNYLGLDVSAFVQNWVNDPTVNNGVLLKIITQNYYNSLIFCSPAHSDSTLWPKLDICYFTPVCTAAASFNQQNLGGGTVQFTNTSSNLSYTPSWSFSNASGVFATSNVNNPKITFSGQPPYSAALHIAGAGGCSDDEIQAVEITNCVTFQRGATRATGALVESILPDQNYQFNNSNVAMLASQWTYNGVPGEDRGLMKFDITSIPAGSIILSAKLSLYADTACPNNGYKGTPTWGSNNASYLKQVTSAWNPATVVWNNQPTTTTANQVYFPQSATTRQDYENMDVSKFVQNWVNNPSANYGMLLDMIGTSYYNSLIFVGPTNVDTAHWPKLEICYLPPAPESNCITLQQGNTKATGAFLDQYFPNKNWNFADGYKELLTNQWTVNGTPVEGKTLFKYNLSQIPTGSTITTARLSLYADTNAVNGYRGTPTYGTNNASYIYKVTTEWDPATVTNATKPSFTTTDGVYLPQSTSTTQDYLDLDMSALVQGWVNDPTTNFGMVLDMIGTKYYNSLIFCSSAYEDSAKWPKLEICFIPPTPVNNCVTLQQGSTKATGAFLDQYFQNKNWDFANGYKELLTNQWTVNGTPVEGRTLFRYDVSQIPAGATITGAKLSLYADTNAVNGYRGTPTYGNNNASYIYKVTSAWDPATVTNVSRPTFTTTNGVYLPQSTSTKQDYLDLDISAFVQDWVNNPATNYGMILDMVGTKYYNSLIFCSSSYEDSAKWPKLEICYTLTGCGAHSAFSQQGLGAGVVQFDNQSSSNAGYYSSWVFYNADGIFATSNVTDPTVTFSGNPPYYASLTVVDSISAPCYDFSYQQIILGGNTDTSKADTLCGYVFNDRNADGITNPGESAAAYTPILIDGVVYYADVNGYFNIAVGAGDHTIGVVPPFGWRQTAPVLPLNYRITTGTNQHICGFDFGISEMPMGVGELATAGSMVLYPNPSNGSSFTVSIPEGFDTHHASVQVNDIAGREVSVQAIDGLQKQTNISLSESITPGIYLVVLKNDHKQITGRLSVIR